MTEKARLLWLTVGMVLGAGAVAFWLGRPHEAQAANDRFDDYILCTGPVGTVHGVPVDGVWMLDYRAGKLLGTVIDRSVGKIGGWAEVDLVTEFGLPPKTPNIHFLMTSGMLNQGQAALYVAEVQSGKFGVYTMGVREGQAGVLIKRHDLVLFRQKPSGS